MRVARCLADAGATQQDDLDQIDGQRHNYGGGKYISKGQFDL